MSLIAKKPCSFGGKKFYIGEEIPVEFVIDPALQEKLGVLAIVQDEGEAPLQKSASGKEKMFTEEEVQALIADAVARAEKAKEEQLAELQKHAAELIETDPEAYESAVSVTVFGEKEDMAMRLSPEEIQQVFSVLQLNAEEGIKVIAGVTSENVLILIHATDGRKTVKNAAKEQAEKLFTTKSDTNPEGS